MDKKPINRKRVIVSFITGIIAIGFIYYGVKDPLSFGWIAIGSFLLLAILWDLRRNIRLTEEEKREQDMKEWEQTREKGKKYYIFKKHAIYSVATGLGFMINEAESHGGGLTVENLLSGNFSLLSVISMLSFFYFVGVIGGLFHYNSQEEKYRKWKLYGNFN